MHEYLCSSTWLGGAYSKKFANITIDKLVKWDGIVVKDGVRGGTEGEIFRRWVEDCANYDGYVDAAMRHARFLQIKRCIKLNNNEATPKCGELGYDPAYKYNFIWDILVHKC